MNEKQKKILKIFIFFGSTMILSSSGIIAFVLYQKQLANNGDVWDKAAAEIHTSWVSPVMAILIGIAVAASLLFIGYWKILKTPENNNDANKNHKRHAAESAGRNI